MAQWQRLLFYFVGIALIVAMVAIIVTQVMLLVREPITDVGDAFLSAIQAGELERAYAMLGPEMQERIREDIFILSFTDANLVNWTFHSRTVEEDSGRVTGEAMMRGLPHEMELEFRKIDGQWFITRYLLQSQSQ